MDINKEGKAVLDVIFSRCEECEYLSYVGWRDGCKGCSTRNAYIAADEVFKAAGKYAWHTDPADVPDTDRKVECRTVTKAGKVNAVFGYYADGRWCCGMNSNVIKWREVEE